MVRNDLSGQRFGRLLVLGFDCIQGKTSRWICSCDCGNTTSVFRSSLVKQTGGTRSCGCFRNECVSKRNVTHGNSFLNAITPEYRAWANMKDRCDNPNNKRYKHYGGRGISYCKRWGRFEAFLKDMGERPSSRHSIDRINNDGNYCKKNCKWSTASEQNANRQCVSLISAYGKTMTAGDWAKLTGLNRSTIDRRIKRGIAPEVAVAHFKLAPAH